jgi:hypothetical protein
LLKENEKKEEVYISEVMDFFGSIVYWHGVFSSVGEALLVILLDCIGYHAAISAEWALTKYNRICLLERPFRLIIGGAFAGIFLINCKRKR